MNCFVPVHGSSSPLIKVLSNYGLFVSKFLYVGALLFFTIDNNKNRSSDSGRSNHNSTNNRSTCNSFRCNSGRRGRIRTTCNSTRWRRGRWWVWRLWSLRGPWRRKMPCGTYDLSIRYHLQQHSDLSLNTPCSRVMFTHYVHISCSHIIFTYHVHTC